MIDVDHDDSHRGAESLRALNFLSDPEFKEPPVEDAGQTVDIGQLPHTLDMLGILNRRGAHIGDGFHSLTVSGMERVRRLTVEEQDSEALAEGEQRDAHARARLRK